PGRLQRADPGTAVPHQRHPRAPVGVKGMMLRNLILTMISAVVALILSGMLMSIRMQQHGSELFMIGGVMDVAVKIGAAALFIFLFNLFRDHLTALWNRVPALPRTPAAISILAARPAAHRLMWCFIIAAAVIWPFLTNRSNIDLATLVLIYVMLGLGLNIVVGLAGLLDLGYVGFYAVGAYTYALLSMYFGSGFW